MITKVIVPKKNPCISDYNNETSAFVNNKAVTNSTMKTYLEDWYVNNLANYNDKVVLGNYCNDTTIDYKDGDEVIFSSESRIYTNSPTLKCLDTSVNYGGNYKLKIGLLSIDEFNLVGLDYKLNEKNYLYSDTLTMTPWYYNNDAVYIFNITKLSGITNVKATAGRGYIYPVINLKSDIQITGGDGTSSNPYVVE